MGCPFLYLEIAINLFCLQGFKSLISVHFNIRAIKNRAVRMWRQRCIRYLRFFQWVQYATASWKYLTEDILISQWGCLGNFNAGYPYHEWRAQARSEPAVCACSVGSIYHCHRISCREYLNRYLGMGIWSYEEVPLNFDGQICLPFAFVWFGLSYIGVLADNFIRRHIFKEYPVIVKRGKEKIPAAVG